MSYRYYLLGETLPVRVIFNEAGLKVGAETPDRRTGDLIAQPTLLSRIEQSPEVQEISEAEFQRRCLLAPKIRH